VARLKAGASTRFGLIDHSLHRKLLEWFAPDLFARVDWLQLGHLYCVNVTARTTATLFGVHYQSVMGYETGRADSSLRTPSMSRMMGTEIQRVHHHAAPPTRRTIVYYQRAADKSSSAKHGRGMPKEHNDYIIDVIRSSMRRFNIRDELVIFSGEDGSGNILSFQEQFNIFSSARVVLGIHGGGLANLVWMRPNKNCEDGPVVLEFICTTESAAVQNGCRTTSKSHFSLLGGIPWIRYHHQFMAANSTADSIYVDGRELAGSLAAIFDSNSGNAQFIKQNYGSRIVGLR
jgi:hypothetical protein